MHFSLLVQHLERFFQSKVATWPVERSLLTTGLLDALLISRRDGGRLVKTPFLRIAYKPTWSWAQPSDLPPIRAIHGQ